MVIEIKCRCGNEDSFTKVPTGGWEYGNRAWECEECGELVVIEYYPPNMETANDDLGR